MSNGTKKRPKIHSGRKGKIKGVRKARQEGCGAWYFQTIPDPPELTTPKRLINGKVNTGLDTVIYFFPNPENQCRNYAFVQFVKRRTTNVDTGEELESESHDWQPDVEGWDNRKVRKFLDLAEIIYNGKRTKKQKPNGMRREDRPGFAHKPGRPPKNRRIRWEYKTYVVCDNGAKVIGMLEFGFEITTDRAGQATLRFPEPKEESFLKLSTVCCKVDDAFNEWVDQWHAHTTLSDLPQDAAERQKRLLEFRTLVLDQAYFDHVLGC